MPQSSPETYVPRPDAEFSAWGGRFMAYVQANFADLGRTATDAIALNAAWIRLRIGRVARVCRCGGSIREPEWTVRAKRMPIATCAAAQDRLSFLHSSAVHVTHKG